MVYIILLALVNALNLAQAASRDPLLPRPDQVDKPENIKFIVPDKSKLAGTVVDNTEAKLVGEWKHSVHTPPFVGVSYIHDMKEKKGQKSATFTPDLPRTGLYEVRVSHNSNIRRANGVPVTVHHSKGKTVVKINEGEPAPIAKLFRSIGLFHFKKGREGSVTISTEGTEGKYVIVDSVQFLIVMPRGYFASRQYNVRNPRRNRRPLLTAGVAWVDSPS